MAEVPTTATNPIQPQPPTPAPQPVKDSPELWHLAALVIMEAPTRMGRLDVTQAIFNRLNSPQVGGPSYGKNITEIAFADGQFEPYFDVSAGQVQGRQGAISVLGAKRRMSQQQAEQLIDEFLADANDTGKMEDARKHVGGRTDFKGVSEYSNMVAGEDRLRSQGENFFHINGSQTHEFLKRLEALGPTSLANLGNSAVPLPGDYGLNCADPGSGGSRTIAGGANNPGTQADALAAALGLHLLDQQKAIKFHALLNPANYPELVNLAAQKTFEGKNYGEGLDGTLTCDEVYFYCGKTLEMEVWAYQPDPNAPAPSVFRHNTDMPLNQNAGVNAAASNPMKTGDVGLQWAMPAGDTNVAGDKCEFGYARGRLHAGIDLGGFGKDDVFAAGDGVIEFTCEIGGAGGYGRKIEIKHPNGWKTCYAHLAKILVQQGQQVTRGQAIGIRGGSGSSSDNDYAIHLHFETINPSGAPVDPRSVLPDPQPPKV